MRTNVLHMAPLAESEQGPEIILSFKPFIDYLKKRDNTNCKKSHFFQYVIEQFDKRPELYGAVDINKVKEYEDLLILIYSIVSPIIEDELTHRWALCLPLKPVVFYYTDAYSQLVVNEATGELRKSIATKSAEEIRRNKLEFTYSLILEKCYGISTFLSREIIHSLHDEEAGLEKYYLLELDTRFVEIQATRPLPELKLDDFHSDTYDKDEMLAFLQAKLSLNMFRFEGFAVINVDDVTHAHSIENIKKALLDRSLYKPGEYSDVVHSLKTLVGSSDVEFGLLPVLKVNDKLVFSDNACMNSKLMSAAKEKGGAEDTYMTLAESYFKNPKMIFFRDIEAEHQERHTYLKILQEKGIHSYALSPVFFNNSLAGVLEIYSKKKGVLNEALLSRLEPAMSLIAQLLKNSIDEFNGSIDQIVKERFTSIQSSVQWKFNEVAWHYLQRTKKKKNVRETEDIVFEKVFPLYGAVDIRNSTVQRNEALQKDLGAQFFILIDTLEKLKEETGFGLIDEKLFSSEKWLGLINDPDGFNQEVKLNDFLENDIIPFLSDFKTGNPEFASIIDSYFYAVDPLEGVAYESRRQLEKSMSTVIAAVNDYMEMMKDEIQKAYPSYFEKVRTDGVEYDIYIGQSIAPEKPFSDIYLKNLRLLQLTSMATIARYTHALKSHLTRPIETTQLIFIHSQAIDIKFRKDEKRFDVEGAYNIRYHIVKKRIDKVNINGTNDRLTQPGKIALVYFSQKEADEYIGYIKYLQQQNILSNDLEKLELEELQGVAGLKAIRVGVVLE